jgi:hypothetical protein
VIVNCHTAVLVLLHVGVAWWSEAVVSPARSCVANATASGRGLAQVPAPVASAQLPPGVHPIASPRAPQLRVTAALHVVAAAGDDDHVRELDDGLSGSSS